MEPLTLTNSEWYVLDSLWERSPMTVMELVRDEALSREDLDQLYEILRQAEERIT